jgi:hypothetical protein
LVKSFGEFNGWPVLEPPGAPGRYSMSTKKYSILTKKSSTKHNSDICLRNNRYIIPHFARHCAKKNTSYQVGGGLELGEAKYDIKKKQIVFMHMLLFNQNTH